MSESEGVSPRVGIAACIRTVHRLSDFYFPSTTGRTLFCCAGYAEMLMADTEHVIFLLFSIHFVFCSLTT